MSSNAHKADDSLNLAILTDVTKCVGCQKCVIACVETNETGDPVPYIYTHPDGLSGSRWTSVLKIGERYVRKQCLHCLEPSCVSACLVGALTRLPNGSVVYDAKKCIGCRYCMIACPFTVPRTQWNTPVPLIRKCIFCYERLEEGKKPACTGACPYSATIFGTRKEMLAEAAHRIETEPDKYINRIWGSDDFGGTSVIYISDVSLEELGFPVGEAAEAWKGRSIPESNWPVVNKTPFLFFGVYSSLFAVSWILNRRMKLAEERKNKDSEE